MKARLCLNEKQNILILILIVKFTKTTNPISLISKSKKAIKSRETPKEVPKSQKKLVEISRFLDFVVRKRGS